MRTVLVLATVAFLCAGCQPKSETVAEVTTIQASDGVVTTSSIHLTGLSVRPKLGNRTATAAYVTLTNKGTTDDRLISAHCECAGTTEVHNMTMDNGVMSMSAMKDGLVIKSGETVTLQPGGKHIMLMALKTLPDEGGQQPITLTFEKAGNITVDFPVRTPAPQ